MKRKNVLPLICCLLLLACSKERGVEELPPAKKDISNANIIADGNSYVVGFGVNPFPFYLINKEPFASNGATLVNLGVNGQATTDMLADQRTEVLPKYKKGVINIFLVEEGGNDIYNNGDVAGAVNRMKQYCRNLKNLGPDAHVFIYTKIPRNNPNPAYGGSTADYNQKLQEYNAQILADRSGSWDGVVEVHRDPLFATFTSAGYQPDQCHPNRAGQNRYAELTLLHLMNFFDQ